MSFAPVWGPESSSHAYIRSSVSACLASLAALCSSLLAAMFTFIDKLAWRIPPSCCIVCQLKSLWCLLVSYFHREEKKENTALTFDPGTEVWALKGLEDIDLEKAIYRKFLPSPTQSIKVQLGKEMKFLAEVRFDHPRKGRGLKHQPSLVDGFYILPGRAGTQTTMTPKDAQEDQLAELPAFESFNQKTSPVELPAEEIAPAAAPPVPQAVFQPASPTPLLLPPKPRSPNTRKASPLLAPPPRDGVSERRTSRGSSVGSASIHIAYLPSQHEDVEREKPEPLKASTPVLRLRLLVSVRGCLVVLADG